MRIDPRHGGIESVDLIEMKAQQDEMGLGHAATRGVRRSSADALTRCNRRG
jgi:hypothetical protein